MFKVFIELPQNSNTRTTEQRVLEIRESIAQTGLGQDDIWFVGRRVAQDFI